VAAQKRQGTTYFSGFLGDCQLLLFRDGKKPHPTRPGEEVIVWKLLVQERDPARRPQGKRDLPTRGGQQAHEATNESADAWSEQERQDHIQKLAERFDEREPDDVPF
jgi:hypothetical protein